MLAVIRVIADKVDVLLKAEVVGVHIIGMGNAYIAEMPRLVLYLGYLFLSLSVADDKAVFIAVCVEPRIIACTVVIVVVSLCEIESKSRFMLAEARLCHLCGLSVLGLGNIVVIELLLELLGTV